MKFSRITAVLLLFLNAPLAPSVNGDELAYPTRPVVGRAVEMPSHLGQYGLPGYPDHSFREQVRLEPAHVVAYDPAPLAERLAPQTVNAAPEKLARVKAVGGSGIFGSVDYLNWTLRRRDQDFAISSDPGAVVISGGEIHELEYDASAGFRTLLGYQVPNGWKVGVGYMMYDTEANGIAEDGTGTLYATRSHPDFNRRAGVATATSSLDMFLLDLEVQNTLQLGSRAELTLLGSFRWAEIGQDFSVLYEDIDFPEGGVVNSLTDTSGFGLRIGANGRWALGSVLYLVGGAETSLLHATTNIALAETSGVQPIVDVSDTYSQVLPGLGAHAGAGVQWGQLHLEMGYAMQAWFDLGDRMSFLDDQHLGVFSHSNHNLLLDGFYLRLGWDH